MRFTRVDDSCPYCKNRKLLRGFNDLATAYPELVVEWDFERNGDLGPDGIVSGSARRVWWRYGRGHAWQISAYNRTGGADRGCPYCGDRKVLSLIRESLAHLEINGPNTIIAVLPDGSMMTCCDSKKLRPVVVGGDGTTMAISSEVCGLNAVLPDRDASRDIYPNEREVVLINNDLAVQRWNQ